MNKKIITYLKKIENGQNKNFLNISKIINNNNLNLI